MNPIKPIPREFTVIFQHIPKTAGSTFHSIIQRHYRTNQIYNVFAANLSDRSITDFINEPDSRKQDIKLLKGHMPFGLHQFLPQQSTYISFVRDPVERIISLYHYIKRNKENPRYEIVKEMTLGEFVESGLFPGNNNGQVRFIAGNINDHPFGACPPSLLDTALEHINRNYAFLGITDLFDESIVVLANVLDWKSRPYYRRLNVTKNKVKAYTASPDEIGIINRYNALDIKLYEYAKERLVGIIKTDMISEQVRQFKRMNRVHQVLRKPFELLGV